MYICVTYTYKYIINYFQSRYFLCRSETNFSQTKSLLVWLRKRTLHSGIFSVEFTTHIGCPPSGAKKGQNMAVTGVSHSCLLIELGPICKSMAASL